ncbi:hypothetical protein F5Y19DRAFT_471999 [Xylariaceae sp. FL1651]|nr:hypothetical protein F5Y19DRAFT_471999 [Xylariaceae sp. FL1651]
MDERDDGSAWQFIKSSEQKQTLEQRSCMLPPHFITIPVDVGVDEDEDEVVVVVVVVLEVVLLMSVVELVEVVLVVLVVVLLEADMNAACAEAAEMRMTRES